MLVFCPSLSLTMTGVKVYSSQLQWSETSCFFLSCHGSCLLLYSHTLLAFSLTPRLCDNVFKRLLSYLLRHHNRNGHFFLVLMPLSWGDNSRRRKCVWHSFILKMFVSSLLAHSQFCLSFSVLCCPPLESSRSKACKKRKDETVHQKQWLKCYASSLFMARLVSLSLSTCLPYCVWMHTLFPVLFIRRTCFEDIHSNTNIFLLEEEKEQSHKRGQLLEVSHKSREVFLKRDISFFSFFRFPFLCVGLSCFLFQGMMKCMEGRWSEQAKQSRACHASHLPFYLLSCISLLCVSMKLILRKRLLRIKVIVKS